MLWHTDDQIGGENMPLVAAMKAFVDGVMLAVSVYMAIKQDKK